MNKLKIGIPYTAVIFFFVALWICAPVFIANGWYHAHDAMRLPYLAYHFKEAFLAGYLYPRWLPDLMLGYGYPTFVFYQPGYFYFTLPFALLFEPVIAVKLSLFAMVLLSMTGAYFLARYWCTPRIATLFAALFLFYPYVERNLYWRAALPELYAQLLLPWSVYFALKLTDALRSKVHLTRTCGGFVFFTSAVIITHPHVALFYLPFVGGLLMVRTLWPRDWMSVFACVALLVLCMALTSPYWFTLLQLKEYVNYEGFVHGYYDVRNMRTWKILGNTILASRQQSWIVFSLLACAGYIVARKNYTIRFTAVYFIFLVFMIGPWSQPVWNWALALLQYLQFPMRLLSVMMTVCFIGLCQLGAPLEQMLSRKPLYGKACIVLLPIIVVSVSLYPYRLLLPFKLAAEDMYPSSMFWDVWENVKPLNDAPNYYATIRKGEKAGRPGIYDMGVYRPKTADIRPLLNRISEPVPVVQPYPLYQELGIITVLPTTTNYHIVAEVSTQDRMAAVVNQVYLPGWKMLVDGQEVRWLERGPGQKIEASGLPDTLAGDATYDDNGRLLIFFNRPGTYHIEAYYDGPPGWKLRNLLIALISAGVVFFLYKKVAKGSSRP